MRRSVLAMASQRVRGAEERGGHAIPNPTVSAAATPPPSGQRAGLPATTGGPCNGNTRRIERAVVCSITVLCSMGVGAEPGQGRGSHAAGAVDDLGSGSGAKNGEWFDGISRGIRPRVLASANRSALLPPKSQNTDGTSASRPKRPKSSPAASARPRRSCARSAAVPPRSG